MLIVPDLMQAAHTNIHTHITRDRDTDANLGYLHTEDFIQVLNSRDLGLQLNEMELLYIAEQMDINVNGWIPLVQMVPVLPPLLLAIYKQRAEQSMVRQSKQQSHFFTIVLPYSEDSRIKDSLCICACVCVSPTCAYEHEDDITIYTWESKVTISWFMMRLCPTATLWHLPGGTVVSDVPERWGRGVF